MPEHDAPREGPATSPPYEPVVIRHHGSIEDVVHFDQLLTEIVSVPPERVDEAIDTAMERLQRELDVDAIAVLRFSENGNDLRLTHHRTRTGVPPPPAEISARAE